MPSDTAVLTSVVCDSIRERRLLAFDYEGAPRLVAPYVHGLTATGLEALRAVQVGGATRSGYGYGKLWSLAKMTNVRLTDRTFVPDDPRYNPDDSAMALIHCRIAGPDR